MNKEAIKILVEWVKKEYGLHFREEIHENITSYITKVKHDKPNYIGATKEMFLGYVVAYMIKNTPHIGIENDTIDNKLEVGLNLLKEVHDAQENKKDKKEIN